MVLCNIPISIGMCLESRAWVPTGLVFKAVLASLETHVCEEKHLGGCAGFSVFVDQIWGERLEPLFAMNRTHHSLPTLILMSGWVLQIALLECTLLFPAQ